MNFLVHRLICALRSIFHPCRVPYLRDGDRDRVRDDDGDRDRVHDDGDDGDDACRCRANRPIHRENRRRILMIRNLRDASCDLHRRFLYIFLIKSIFIKSDSLYLYSVRYIKVENKKAFEGFVCYFHRKYVFFFHQEKVKRSN